jgi:ATP-dependent 26S proteasome regulatory subunit
MNHSDLMLTNMMFGLINKISTGYIILDFLYIMTISYLFQGTFKRTVARFFEMVVNYFDKTNKLIFTSSEKQTSQRFRALMHYISKMNLPTVRILAENIEQKYNSKTDEYEEKPLSIYRVDQPTTFTITPIIKGRVYYMEKEKQEFNGKVIYNEIVYLDIFTSTLKMSELEEWVEERLQEYKNYLKTKSCGKQLIVEVSYNPKKNDIAVFNTEWSSNVTFENRFFTNKDNILEKINFFLKNPQWYKERGIPYTMGFLLWGEPGCGKTGFIKALMNLTGRHAVSIKLNNNFNMNNLRTIIYDDMINDDLIIPQSNRILIFEDIDCMGDIVKTRTAKTDSDEEPSKRRKHKYSESDSDEDADYKLLKSHLKNQQTDNYNNNLSYFLNMLDGLQECPGRIIIMTTNKPEQLDKALIRPGRIDFNINFTKATIDDIKNILEFYWEEFADDIPDYCNMKYSHAEVVNMCRTSNTIEETIKQLEQSAEQSAEHSAEQSAEQTITI